MIGRRGHTIKKLVFFLLGLPLWGQSFGIAVQDDVRSAPLNPAALGLGNSPGFSYSNRYDVEQGFFPDFDFTFSLPYLAYSYGFEQGEHKNSVAGGVPLGWGNYLGARYDWRSQNKQEEGLALSYLVRPTEYLSLTVLGEGLLRNREMTLGVGVRPFPFWSYLRSRLTITGDLRYNRGWNGYFIGAFLEPFDGFKLYGGYDFGSHQGQIGLSVVTGYSDLTNSATINENGYSVGEFRYSRSYQRQRTVFAPDLWNAVEYDMADVILDAPVPGYRGLGEKKVGVKTLMDFILDMEAIKKDRYINYLIFKGQDFKTNFANILEIESVLKDLKKAGKRIFFYFESMGNLDYALAASVADGIYLSPGGTVGLKGFGTTRYYLKDFFDNWGVRLYNFQSHEYKTAFNSFSESKMTNAEREVLESLYRSLQQEMNRMINEGRAGKLSQSVQEVVNQGPYIYASKALELGLIDQIGYEDQFRRDLYQRYRARPYKASQRPPSRSYEWQAASSKDIVVIYALGNIVSGQGVAGKTIGSDSLVEALRAAMANPNVKGVVLRVNSRGGSALASDVIAREVALLSKGNRAKPIVVSMGGAAASGGYYISAPAAKIVASPVSLTGSIGVVTAYPEIVGFLDKLNIGVDTVKSADQGDAPSFLRGLSPVEGEAIWELVNDSYNRFVSVVSENRGMSFVDAHVVSQGRVWTGNQALQRQLVDATGGLYDALRLVKRLVGEGGLYTNVVEVVPGRNPSIVERYLLSPVMEKWDASMPFGVEEVAELYSIVGSYRAGEALYYMPYSPSEIGVSW